jgi:hypothetical protein
MNFSPFTNTPLVTAAEMDFAPARDDQRPTTTRVCHYCQTRGDLGELCSHCGAPDVAPRETATHIEMAPMPLLDA